MVIEDRIEILLWFPISKNEITKIENSRATNKKLRLFLHVLHVATRLKIKFFWPMISCIM